MIGQRFSEMPWTKKVFCLFRGVLCMDGVCHQCSGKNIVLSFIFYLCSTSRWATLKSWGLYPVFPGRAQTLSMYTILCMCVILEILRDITEVFKVPCEIHSPAFLLSFFAQLLVSHSHYHSLKQPKCLVASDNFYKHSGKRLHWWALSQV